MYGYLHVLGSLAVCNRAVASTSALLHLRPCALYCRLTKSTGHFSAKQHVTSCRFFSVILQTALAVGAAISPTSLGFSAQMLSEAGELTTPGGQLICTAAVVDDVFSLLLLAEVQALGQEDAEVSNGGKETIFQRNQIAREQSLIDSIGVPVLRTKVAGDEAWGMTAPTRVASTIIRVSSPRKECYSWTTFRLSLPILLIYYHRLMVCMSGWYRYHVACERLREGWVGHEQPKLSTKPCRPTLCSSPLPGTPRRCLPCARASGTCT